MLLTFLSGCAILGHRDDASQIECLCEPYEFMPSLHSNPRISDVELYVTRTYNNGTRLNWGITNNTNHVVGFNGQFNAFVYCDVSRQYRMVLGSRDEVDIGVDIYPGECMQLVTNWEPPIKSARYKIVVRQIWLDVGDIREQFIDKWGGEFPEGVAENIMWSIHRPGSILEIWGDEIINCPLARELHELSRPHSLVAYFECHEDGRPMS